MATQLHKMDAIGLTQGALIWTAVVYQLGLMVLSNAQNNAPGYLGCFKDGDRGIGTRRSLLGNSTHSNSLSLELCFNFCLNNNAYKYAGVEYETECYCGNNEDYGRHGETADSDCRVYTCPGNTNQYCGGDWRIAIYQIVPLTTISYIAPSLLPTTMNQTNNTSMVTNSTNVTTSSGVPSSIPDTTIPDTTDRPEMSDPQTIQTETIIGIAVGVIASLVVLLVIVISRRRQKRRGQSTNGANGSVNKLQADVTPTSMYEIPSRPGTVNQKPPEYDVIAESTYETPGPPGAVNPNPKESDVTTSVMSAYEIPRPPTNKNHQFTREDSRDVIVHEYADFKLSSQE